MLPCTTLHLYDERIFLRLEISLSEIFPKAFQLKQEAQTPPPEFKDRQSWLYYSLDFHLLYWPVPMLLSSGMDIHAYSSGSLPSRLVPLQALWSLSMGAFVCAIIHPCDLALEHPVAKNSQHEPSFRLLEI